MMQPRFDDVIEFVRDGEEDTDMAELLEKHPDGEELLKQARFICKLLEGARPEPPRAMSAEVADSKVWGSASFEVSEERIDIAKSMRMLSVGRADRRSPGKRFPDLADGLLGFAARAARSIAGQVEDLGELEIDDDGYSTGLTHRPAILPRKRPLEPELLSESRSRRDLGFIEIHGAQIRLVMPESVPAGAPLPIHVFHSPKKFPISKLELVFMPEDGPFRHLTTDDRGGVSLPRPFTGGTLRIETGRPQVLRLAIKDARVF